MMLKKIIVRQISVSSVNANELLYGLDQALQPCTHPGPVPILLNKERGVNESIAHWPPETPLRIK